MKTHAKISKTLEVHKMSTIWASSRFSGLGKEFLVSGCLSERILVQFTVNQPCVQASACLVRTQEKITGTSSLFLKSHSCVHHTFFSHTLLS